MSKYDNTPYIEHPTMKTIHALAGSIGFMRLFCLSSALAQQRRLFLCQILRQSSTLSWTVFPFTAPHANAATDEGVPQVTDSSIGKFVRKSTIQGARLFDQLDEKWERFSDNLRDEQKCDPNTNRRLFDNGFRRDGTRVGNPVLGSLCKPEPLLSLNQSFSDLILKLMVDSVMKLSGNDKGASSTFVADIEYIQQLVRPSFERSMAFLSLEEQRRQQYNFSAYCTMKAISNLTKNSLTKIRAYQSIFGNALLDEFANGASKMDYHSPFRENQDEIFGDYDYDKDSLSNSLGAVCVVLDKFKSAGLNGYYEISIPYDDYGSVVTVAVDDHVAIGADMLLVEQQGVVGGSYGPHPSLLRAALERSNLSFAMDIFYIDPATTKQNIYNPTQLLLSVNNLRKA